MKDSEGRPKIMHKMGLGSQKQTEEAAAAAAVVRCPLPAVNVPRAH